MTSKKWRINEQVWENVICLAVGIIFAWYIVPQNLISQNSSYQLTLMECDHILLIIFYILWNYIPQYSSTQLTVMECDYTLLIHYCCHIKDTLCFTYCGIIFPNIAYLNLLLWNHTLFKNAILLDKCVSSSLAVLTLTRVNLLWRCP